jgi:hypothetical protein
MGYYMSQQRENFFVPSNHVNDIVRAIHRLALDKQDNGCSWVDDSILDMDDVKDIFRFWGWAIEQNMDGDIVYINFDAEKLMDDDVLFRVIAPFVKHNSYIEMCGEDNTMWRWAFKNGVMIEQTPKITWE